MTEICEACKKAEVQWTLTAECWIVQLEGAYACSKCEFRDSNECGGKKIRMTQKNEKGQTVPLGSAYTGVGYNDIRQ